MSHRPILILGANGQLGRAFQSRLASSDRPFLAPDEREFNLTDFTALRESVRRAAPSAIINCAAYNAVDDAETDPAPANLINHAAVENLAAISRNENIPLIHYSTDYVFDGNKKNFYTEADQPNPLNAYGRSKLAGEQAVLQGTTNGLVFRTSWVFGDGVQNFIYKLRGWAEKNPVLQISSDEVSVPTYTHDMVDVTLRAMDKGVTGLFHLTNTGYASRYEWARFVAEGFGLQNLIIPVPLSSFPSKAERPLFSSMSNEKISGILGITIPHWKDAVGRYLQTLTPKK